jgi:hypothetical protein
VHLEGDLRRVAGGRERVEDQPLAPAVGEDERLGGELLERGTRL